ncbi:RING-type E3 ubiquitin transferase [Salvia divinorum]|uniref:RING-type E3 ubiquitin transferase n=1 Tax=Salvia divinorum TaxID=28513 RepID=A0ABD1HFU2_SALDI
MRKIPSLGARVAMAVAEFDSRISPPLPPVSHPERCDAQKCPWWPYSSSKEFKANTALIIVVLFCALICALAFNAGIRYIVRLHCGGRRQKGEQNGGAAAEAAEVLGLSYAEGMKLAGEETECIICLADFAVGEKIRVLDKCKHGFHLNCIQRWLISHSSCPTCRTNCSTPSAPSPP